MSEQVRHKMIDFAVEPPPAAWESIAGRLDDDRQYVVLASKMNHLEATPPAGCWENISTRLGDDGQYAVVSAKMKDFEAVPPPRLWNAIAASLEEKSVETVAPVINIRKTIYRALAAAVIIGVLLGGWMFITRNTVATEIVKDNSSNTTTPVGKKEDSKISGDNISTVEKDVPLATQHQIATLAANSHPGNGSTRSEDDDRILKYAVVNSLPAFREGPIVISSAPIVDENGVVIRNLDVLSTNSNYIMVAGPNGQLTRMSVKFASVIRYLNDGSADTEEYLDKVIKESDTWKKRFQEWRSKISQSSFIPSSANFLDIIEFKELIQEQQQ